MTGRGAAREHEQPPPGRVDEDAGGAAGERRPRPAHDQRGQPGVPPRPRPQPSGEPPSGPDSGRATGPDSGKPTGPDTGGTTGPEGGKATGPGGGKPTGADSGRATGTDSGGTTGADSAGVVDGAAAGLEPTTGAPVGAVPRRVPIREHPHGPPPTTSGGGTDDGDEFWLPIEEVHWDGTPIRAGESTGGADTASARRARTRRTRPRVVRQRDPLPGLAGLLGLSLLAAFFAWVSAEPFWLAVGHSTTGSVLSECTGSGLGQRCRGVFLADDGRFVAHGVRVSGLTAEQRAGDGPVPARMTGPEARTAYADRAGTLHLRWLFGFGLVAACATGIARVTGTAGLAGRRSRRWAFAVAAGGPALVTLGFLVAAF